MYTCGKEYIGNTLGQGDIPPAGTDAELIDHANEIAGRNARFFEDLREQCILGLTVSEGLMAWL